MANETKVQTVAEYGELLKDAKSVYLADYKGLKVDDMQSLRRQFRESDVTFTVVKNRLMRRAASEAGMEGLGEHLVGPVAVAISRADEVAPAKIIVKFAKENEAENLKLKAAVVDGQVYGPEGAAELSKLPSLDEVRAKMLNLFNTPASQIARVVAAPGTKVAQVLKARADQLEKQG